MSRSDIPWYTYTYPEHFRHPIPKKTKNKKKSKRAAGNSGYKFA